MVRQRRMIEWVVSNIAPTRHHRRFIFVVRDTARQAYALDRTLVASVAKASGGVAAFVRIIEVDHTTEGTACTALLARHLIEEPAPLLMANSDQIIEWGDGKSVDDFLECAARPAAGGAAPDGCISTFHADNPAFSYAAVSPHGDGTWVTEVAEKKVISNHATTGIYLWARGEDFTSAADAMIDADIRIKGEFYVAPTYNLMLEPLAAGEQRPQKLRIWPVHRFWSLGVPADLEYFLEHFDEEVRSPDALS